MSLFHPEQLGLDLEAECERAFGGNPHCPALETDLLEAAEIALDEDEPLELRAKCARRLAVVYGIENLPASIAGLLEAK